MPLASKANGYPVDAATAAAAVVEKAPEANGDTSKKLAPCTTQPSLKDRSIINQAAWKSVQFAATQYAGNAEQWYAVASKLQRQVEADMLSVYSDPTRGTQQ
jgi:hypothetical protein